ncbi:hypothetical protein Trydic_g20504 [Trypoxylus dichotomus]
MDDGSASDGRLLRQRRPRRSSFVIRFDSIAGRSPPGSGERGGKIRGECMKRAAEEGNSAIWDYGFWDAYGLDLHILNALREKGGQAQDKYV